MCGRFVAQVSRRSIRWLASPLLFAALACGSDRTLYIGVHETDAALEPDSTSTTGAEPDAGIDPPDCEPPGTPPDELSANGFYTKYAENRGIPILAPPEVEDQAVAEACSIVQQMLSERSDVAEEMAQNGARVAIVDEDRRLTELPDFQDLGPEWDDERGAGATLEFPTAGAAEENLLCLESDVYHGEVLLVHAFAHAVRNLGIRPLEEDFDTRLATLYETALDAGKWQDTYAATTRAQYWAEGVQSFYGVNLERDPPDGIHNYVNTPEELLDYDPALFELIDEYLPENLTVSCF